MFPLLALLGIACSAPDDTGTPPPEDSSKDSGGETAGDSAPDTGLEPFAPVYWTWNLYTGVQDGLTVPVTYLGEAMPPYLDVLLLAPEYPKDPTPEGKCQIRYTVTGESAILDPGQILGWELSLAPLDTTCDRLDPVEWGEDPFTFGLAHTWAMAALPLDPLLEKTLDAAGIRTDHVIGADTWLDGASVAEANAQQTHYASAVEVDADMVVNPGDVLDADALLAGTDAWWVLHHAYLFEI